MTDKLVYITGAGRGIGQSMAIELSKQGYVIAGCARNISQLEQTKALVPGKMYIDAVDVVDYQAQADWFERIAQNSDAQAWGLVCCAGTFGPIGPFHESDIQSWAEAIDVNLMGTVQSVHLFSRQLISNQSPGRMMLLSGGGATKPMPNFSSYGASKSALVRFAETVAEELIEHGISVNTIAPGAINTQLMQEVLKAGPDIAGQAMFDMAQKIAKDGGQDPVHAAKLVGYLMAEDASGITGKLISAIWDPWIGFKEQAEALRRTEVYTLRRVVPEVV